MTDLLRLDNLALDLEEDATPGALKTRVAQKLGVSPEQIAHIATLKRSLDCRGTPRAIYSAHVRLHQKDALRKLPKGARWDEPTASFEPPPIPREKRDTRVIVIGAGPAGLFAAMHLARAGLKPILLEQGKPVETRAQDVSRLMHWGELQSDSNLCYGEGGAGTWSDGKLTTRIGAPQVRHVLETLVDMGAPDRILTDGKPHLGTDRLIAMLKTFRASLTDMGADTRFSCKVIELLSNQKQGKITGVRLSDGTIIDASAVILAVGHSSRKMYASLLEQGVTLVPKPFAVGFRVEHPQSDINEMQYKRHAEHPLLPAADYRVTANLKVQGQKRGVYSFCMCPGGQVVPTPTEPDGVVVNGMSHAARSGAFANSALVVTVNPEDFGSSHPLAGVDFQRRAEKAAGALGGGWFRAPAQSLHGYLKGNLDKSLRKTSYTPGVTPADLSRCYPGFITESLRIAIQQWGRKHKPFVTDQALLIGVETRTSAPVQITRGDDYQSISMRGLYPCGEGAGYGGGIVSAAVDGLRVAHGILEALVV